LNVMLNSSHSLTCALNNNFCGS